MKNITASAKDARLLPASNVPGLAGFPPVKVRAAVEDTLPSRGLLHQDNSNGILIKDLLKYDEVPGITNCSTVSVPAGMVIDKHLHPSKYEVFLVSAGRGVFRVWSVGAAANDEPREVIELRQGVCCTVGPEEPHEIHAESNEPLVMTYFGVVASAG